ncbi:hypothetical protein FHR66_000939 [Xanthomonas sp. F4]|nr:hypothetical protein [Xanthomonas sp. 3498]
MQKKSPGFRPGFSLLQCDLGHQLNVYFAPTVK